MKKNRILHILICMLCSFLFLIILLHPNQKKIIQNFFEKICSMEKEEYEKLSNIQDDNLHDDERNSNLTEETLYQYYNQYVTKSAVPSLIKSGILSLGLRQHQYNEPLEIESLSIEETASSNGTCCYEYEIVWTISDNSIVEKGRIYFADAMSGKITQIMRID